MPIFARQRRAPYKVKNRRMGVRLSVLVTQKRRSIISSPPQDLLNAGSPLVKSHTARRCASRRL